ncbi:MAG: hypothetical protein VXB67_17440, partial [Deltaproteobacteria bacterium]
GLFSRWMSSLKETLNNVFESSFFQRQRGKPCQRWSPSRAGGSQLCLLRHSVKQDIYCIAEKVNQLTDPSTLKGSTPIV